MYIIGAIFIGFASSILSGMFGIGGASLSTPAIRVLLGATPAVSLGTTLPVAIPTSLAGALTYSRKGFVDRKAVLFSSTGGIFGSISGSLLTKVINLHYLMLVTGLVVLYLACATIISGYKRKRVDVEIGIEIEEEPKNKDPSLEVENEWPPEVGWTEKEIACHEPEKQGKQGEKNFRLQCKESSKPWLYIVIGFLGGSFSGLLGIGGGIVLIPAFLYILRMPIKKAFGTSLAVIGVIAIPGTVVHAFLGHISGWLFLYLTTGVIPGAYIGAKLAIKAREPALYAGFGALTFCFGIIFIVNEIISMVR